MSLSTGEEASSPSRSSLNESGLKPSRYNWDFRFNDEMDIWFNGMTGASLLLDRNTSEVFREALSGNRLVRSDDPIVRRQERSFAKLLETGGFAVAEECDEVELLRLRHMTAKIESRGRLGFTIAPTMACNLRCPYCYAFKNAKSMTPEVMDGVTAFIRRCIEETKAEFVQVMYVGGEPTVAFADLVRLNESIARECERAKCKLSSSVTTNGVLLDDEKISALLQPNMALRRIQISFDGPKHIHDQKRYDGKGGTYDRLLEVLGKLHGRVDVDIRINVDREVTPDDTVALVSDLVGRKLIGVRNGKRMMFYLAPVAASTDMCVGVKDKCYSRTEFVRLFREVYSKFPFGRPPSGFPEPRPMYCGLVSRYSYAIDSEGWISKCWEALGDERCRVGHVLDGLPNEHNPVWRKWLLHDPILEKPQCKPCKFLPICMGGCPQVAFQQGWTEELCDQLKHDLEDRLVAATRTHLTLKNHRLADPQLAGFFGNKE